MNKLEPKLCLHPHTGETSPLTKTFNSLSKKQLQKQGVVGDDSRAHTACICGKSHKLTVQNPFLILF